MSKTDKRLKRAEKLMQMTLKIQESLEASEHPDVRAAAWVMMNLISALAHSSFSERPVSTRIEGNVLTALCFRNGPIEKIHANKGLLEQSDLQAINIWSSRALTGALTMKGICTSLGPDGEEFWQSCILAYHEHFCSGWELTHEVPADYDL